MARGCEAVLMVAQNIGCARASDHDTLEELFSAKFSEALKTVGKSLNFEELYQARDRFREMIVNQIGDNLLGFAWKLGFKQAPTAELSVWRDRLSQGPGL